MAVGLHPSHPAVAVCSKGVEEKSKQFKIFPGDIVQKTSVQRKNCNNLPGYVASLKGLAGGQLQKD